jgi:N-acetylglucosamine-6-sulfatase
VPAAPTLDASNAKEVAIKRPQALLTLVLAVGLVAFSGGPGFGREDTAGLPGQPPDVVVIVTDDMRYDDVAAMPALGRLLIDEGVSFSPNGIISDPLCCPSRATILTGTYSHTNGVYGNSSPQGFVKFRAKGDEQLTLAVALHAIGYRTALIGKYLNGYFDTDAGYVPPGWDRWFAFTTQVSGGSDYYDYTVSDQGVPVAYGSSPEDYSTDVLADRAEQFIASTPQSQRLFLYFTPFAPHGPSTPPLRHTGAADAPPLETNPNFNEADPSDKPRYIRNLPLLNTRSQNSKADRRWQSLLAVDDALAGILATLEQAGRLDNTIVFFISDQGVELGSHRFDGKLVPYEETIRVPFVVRWDALGVAPRIDASLVSNVDIAPTIAAVTGAAMSWTEGRNLAPLLLTPQAPWRSDLLLEHGTGADPPPSYCGDRARNFMYATYVTGEEEFYDLTIDPYELQNRVQDPAYAARVQRARDFVARACVPLPPGFAKR